MNAWLLPSAVAAMLALQAVPPRDTSTTRAGTAIVRGRITAAATSQPLHRVRVTLNTQNPNPPATVTDTRGEFEFTGVTAGTYSITAVRAGYLTMQYGQRRPREAGRSLEIRDGDVIERVDMALNRGGVIAGTITDDVGEPQPGVRVEAIEFRHIRGRRVPVQAASAGTNDRGEFRLSNLEPGTYTLRASSTDTWQSDDGKSTLVYAPTYLPGVTAADQAQRLSVSVGQRLSNLDFTLHVGQAARITGVLQNASGEAMPLQMIRLSRATRGVGGALFSTQGAGSARTDAAGSFVIQGLAPGEYILHSGSDTEGATLSIVVNDGDARSVTLTPRKPSAVGGTVVTDDGATPPFLASRLRVIPIATDPESLLPSFTGADAASVNRDWTFRIVRMDGQYLFRIAGLPDDWMVSAVSLDGRAIADTALDVPAGGIDTSGLRIVISRKGGTIEGTVVDRQGAPTADSTVVVFPAEPAKWTIASRFVKAARPDHAGKFSIGGLPAGSYRAIAQDYVAEGQWEDPEFLTSVLRDAVPIDIAEGSRQSVTLKIQEPR